jgi:hypothetical protein
VKRQRTASSAVKQERQALLRRAAICFRRTVHSGTARAVDRIDRLKRLVRGSFRITYLALNATFLRKISGVKYFVSDLSFLKDPGWPRGYATAAICIALTWLGPYIAVKSARD